MHTRDNPKVRTLIAIGLLAIAATARLVEANDRSATTPEQSQWVDGAGVDADFGADVAVGKLEFVGLTGQTLVLPSVGILRYHMCYEQYAGIRLLDVGSELIYDRTDLELREPAYDYAGRYNTLLTSYLNENGLTDCPSSVDWNDAWQLVSDYLGIDRRRDRGTMAMGRDAVRVYLNTFSRHERAAAHICSLLQRSGLDRNYAIEISPRELIHTENEDDILFTMICRPTTPGQGSQPQGDGEGRGQ